MDGDGYDEECWACGTSRDIQFHHIYGGVAFRHKSTKYGLIVPLCRACHTGDKGVHMNYELNLSLKQWGQRRFEETHTRKEFMSIFGKNYLEDE